jgi:hypothetical protein
MHPCDWANQTLRKPAVLLRPSSSSVLLRPPESPPAGFRTAHARGVFFSVRSGAVVSQDHSAVSTVRLGVQFRWPKAT